MTFKAHAVQLPINKEKVLKWEWWHTGTGCLEIWGMPCPWRLSCSSCTRLWAAQCSCRRSCSLHGSWTARTLKVPFNCEDPMKRRLLLFIPVVPLQIVPWIILMAFSWTCFYKLHLSWGQSTEDSTPECSSLGDISLAQSRKKDHFLQPAGHISFKAAQDTIGFLDCEGTVLANVHLAIHQYAHVSLGRAALGFVEPQQVHLRPVLEPMEA